MTLSGRPSAIPLPPPPQSAAAWIDRGNAHFQRQQWQEAAAAFQQAIRVSAREAGAHFNLGNTWRRLGQLRRAVDAYQQAIRLDASLAAAHLNLGLTWRQLGELQKAAASYVEALRIDPELAEAYNNLGGIWMQAGYPQQAAVCYEQAVRCAPDQSVMLVNLGHSYREQGELAKARQCFQRLAGAEPEQPLHRLRAITLCPRVLDSRQEGERYAEEFLRRCRELAERPPRLRLDDVARLVPEPPFDLQFLPGNLREHKRAYASIFRELPQPERLPPSGPPTVALLVTNKHEPIFLRSLGDLLSHLRPRGFELAVVCSPSGGRRIQQYLQGSARVVPLPESLAAAADTLRNERFDVLCYWEIGTDALNYFLPLLRLAPVQCTTWGVQVTSGIPQVDYYLSSGWIEPDDAQLHYSERLLLAAEGMLTYQPNLLAAGAAATGPGRYAGRQQLGLPPSARVYACPQNLGKLHPDFDSWIGEILRQDPRGIFVATGDRFPAASERLAERWRRALPDVAQRLRLLPRLAEAEYRALLAAADVLLDPPHFGGVNSTLDAFAAGQLVVTLPSPLQRGRYTAACYRMLGLDELIAGDRRQYVSLAVRLAGDADYRHHLQRRLRSALPQLVANTAAVASFGQLLEQLLQLARSR